MFKLDTRRTLRERVRGIFPPSIPYEVRVEDGNWSKYFGKYQNQKWGYWDSNSCWCLSAVNCLEDQLEWLWKNNQFSAEAKTFFQINGYIDSDGDFSVSERFFEILSGVKDDGNSASEAWRLMKKYGILPRSLLTYNKARAEMFPNKENFNLDYFNKAEVTQGMLDMAKESLKYINIDYQQLGTPWTTPEKNLLRTALRQAPVQIGIPIPRLTSNWNLSKVQYDGKKGAEHAVELFNLPLSDEYYIFDQYEPHLKNLSSDYYIPLCTQGIVTAIKQESPNPVNQKSVWGQVWSAVWKWFVDKDFVYKYP